MKKLILLTATLLIALHSQAQVPTDNPMHSKIDSIIQKAAVTFMKNPGKVCLSVGIIDGGKFYKYNYGEVAPGSGKLPSSNTLYEIASITKTFTDLLLACAIEEKKISLNDDIRKFLKGEYPNLQYADGRPVKIAYVVGHVARLPRNTVKQLDDTFTDADFDNELHAVKLDTLQPYRNTYSNLGYQLLGKILENAYGMTYNQLVKKYITGPLNMPATQVYPANNNFIRGYDLQHQEIPNLTAVYPGAGGLRSNIDDLLKYTDAQMKESSTAIKMTHKLFFNDAEHAEAWAWALGRTRSWDYFIREDGGSRGFRTMITMFPEYNIGVILLSNETDNDAGGQLWDTTNEIFNSLKVLNIINPR